MFETEADFAETKMLVECKGDYSKKKGYKKGWQDGAEFGYNKAKKEDKTLIEKRIAELEKVNAELKDKLYLRESLLRMLVFWRKKNKKEFNAYFRKAEELFFEGVNYDV